MIEYKERINKAERIKLVKKAEKELENMKSVIPLEPVEQDLIMSEMILSKVEALETKQSKVTSPGWLQNLACGLQNLGKIFQ